MLKLIQPTSHKFIALLCLVLFQSHVSAYATIDTPVGVKDEGIFYVYELTIPPLNDSSLKKLEFYNQTLKKQKTDKQRQKINDSIKKLHDSWNKTAIKTAFVLFRNPNSEKILTPVEISFRKQQIEVGKYYSAKITQTKKNKSIDKVIRRNLISAQQCKKPNWWDNVWLYGSWSNRYQTLILNTDGSFNSQSINSDGDTSSCFGNYIFKNNSLTLIDSNKNIILDKQLFEIDKSHVSFFLTENLTEFSNLWNKQWSLQEKEKIEQSLAFVRRSIKKQLVITPDQICNDFHENYDLAKIKYTKMGPFVLSGKFSHFVKIKDPRYADSRWEQDRQGLKFSTRRGWCDGRCSSNHEVLLLTDKYDEKGNGYLIKHELLDSNFLSTLKTGDKVTIEVVFEWMILRSSIFPNFAPVFKLNDTSLPSIP